MSRLELHQSFAEIVEALERCAEPPGGARQTLTAIARDPRTRRDQLPGQLARSIHEMDREGAHHAPGDYGQAVPRVRQLLHP